jgi:hypothetical protein
VIEFTDNRMVWEYFHRELGLHESDDFRGVLHVPDEYQGMAARMEHVAVAVGYNAFIGKTCCMHTVIRRPEKVTRSVVREAFEFPFAVAGCVAVLALVDSTNEAALSFDKKLGFTEILRIPDGGLDGDLVVLQMLRSECRWLRPH